MRGEHSQITHQAARFALKEKQDEQLKTAKSSMYCTELKSRKVHFESKKSMLIAESKTREAQRNLKIAKLEADLW